MRKWGIIITISYFLILAIFLLPAWIFLGWGTPSYPRAIFTGLFTWIFWAPTIALVLGQALLLFLSVDTSQKRLRPSTHVFITIVLTSMLLAVLACAAIFSVIAAVRGDHYLRGGDVIVFGSFFLSWIFWGIVFLTFSRDASQIVTRATSWLLKGSILELIIAVVCHVIVRRRNDCSAPIATSFGIVSGIAIMLISFGPSVLFLLAKRMDERTPRSHTAS